MSSETSETPTTSCEPTVSPEPTPSFGWTTYAERMNGRFAMVGIVLLLLIEFFSQQDFFTWLGLR